jgi:hypothetical protein
MKGGDWFVVLLILIEFGASVAYLLGKHWTSAGVWGCIAASNVFYLLTMKGIANGN